MCPGASKPVWLPGLCTPLFCPSVGTLKNEAPKRAHCRLFYQCHERPFASFPQLPLGAEGCVSVSRGWCQAVSTEGTGQGRSGAPSMTNVRACWAGLSVYLDMEALPNISPQLCFSCYCLGFFSFSFLSFSFFSSSFWWLFLFFINLFFASQLQSLPTHPSSPLPPSTLPQKRAGLPCIITQILHIE